MKSSIEKKLVEYCNDWAWNVGRYFHTQNPFDLAAESMEPPEKAIHSFIDDLNVKLLSLHGVISLTENKIGLNTVGEMIKELSGIDVTAKNYRTSIGTGTHTVHFSDPPSDGTGGAPSQFNPSGHGLKFYSGNIPRRIRLDLNEPAELAIHNAIQEIEKMGADERLTKAQNLLSQAKDLVSDFIDEETSPPTPSQAEDDNFIYCNFCKCKTLQVVETTGMRCQKCENQNPFFNTSPNEFSGYLSDVVIRNSITDMEGLIKFFDDKKGSIKKYIDKIQNNG